MRMFQNLKQIKYGADRSQYEYLSYMRDHISLLTIIQQDNDYNEGIYERLDSTLLNLKLVSGKIHSEELKTKQKRQQLHI